MTEFDPDKIFNEVFKAGEAWSDTKAAYETLDRNTKSVLADITRDFMDGASLPRVEAEMRAQSSGDYKAHLASVSAAHKAYLRAQVYYDSVKMLAELRRSEESTRRQEMKL